MAEAKRVYHKALTEARNVFGADTDSETLVRTAAGLVFIKKHTSIAEAKQVYDRALTDARNLFGADTDSRAIVHTAALQVFSKKYHSIAEAKQAYDKFNTVRPPYGTRKTKR